MNDKPIELILRDGSHIENPESQALRIKAVEIISTLQGSAEDSMQLPEVLLELLTSIIKPLFSESSHPRLTSTGRKVLVNNTLPSSITGRFSSFELEDGTNRPMWKNGWSSLLLVYVIGKYAGVGRADTQAGLDLRRKILEAHFYLIVPPILKQLDDVQVAYKGSGCQCLQTLCETLASMQSTILRQSGLMDVFVDAVRNNFSMLPTLTPEDESLELYTALYPAYRYLVKAYSIHGREQVLNPSKVSASQKNIHNGEALSYLTLLLRHQLLHSLVHLSTATGAGSTMSVPLSTFLLSQIGWIVSDMGIHAVVHLQSILPLLRNVLVDPFATSAPGLLLESLKALQHIIQICWPRIKEKWWGECLRGCITCWLNLCDDEAHIPDGGNLSRGSPFGRVKQQLRVTVCLLEDVVGEKLSHHSMNLIDDMPELVGLFTPASQPNISRPEVNSLVSEVES